jgi:NADPH:quinone reductase-like Zn-dependent oxidoreductase
MLAAKYTCFGPPTVLKLEHVPTPKPQNNEVLIQVHASSLNPIDCDLRNGRLKFLQIFRKERITGSDFAGKIIEVGSKCTRLKPGDDVFGFVPPLKGGGCAEFLAVKENYVAKMPPSLNYGEAASLPLVSLTALQALRNLARLKIGDMVFIHGASGGVGTIATQIARHLGAEVHASCSSKNTQFVRQYGADQVINYNHSLILGLSDCYDVFFDVYGNMPFQKIKHLLFPRGRHITTIPSPYNFCMEVLTKLFSFKGTYVVVVTPNFKDLELIADLVNEHHLKPVIDRALPLSEISKAHAYLETRRACGKVIITI